MLFTLFLQIGGGDFCKPLTFSALYIVSRRFILSFVVFYGTKIQTIFGTSKFFEHKKPPRISRRVEDFNLKQYFSYEEKL